MNSIANTLNRIQKLSINGWGMLALVSLTLASLLAIVLILMRLPNTPFAAVQIATFHGVLVLHVTLSFTVWLTSALCQLTHEKLLKQPRTPLSLLAALGLVLMVLAAALPSYRPVPFDYFPLSTSGCFIAGILCYLTAVALTAIQGLKTPSHDSQTLLLKLSLACLLLALASPLLLLLQLPDEAGTLGLQRLLWAAGHIYVCAIGTALAALWIKAGTRQPLLNASGWVPLLGALLTLGLSLVYGSVTRPQLHHDLFMYLMMYASCVPLLVAILGDLRPLLHDRVSIIMAGLLALATLQGFYMTFGTLTVPAHYHAVLGLTNLLLFRSLCGTAHNRRWLAAYGTGVLLVSLSLWFLGNLGAARKVTYAHPWVMDSLQYSLYCLLTLGGVVMFAATLVICVRLAKKLFPRSPAKPRQAVAPIGMAHTLDN